MEYRFKLANLICVVAGAFTMGMCLKPVVSMEIPIDWSDTILLIFLLGFFGMAIPILKARVRFKNK